MHITFNHFLHMLLFLVLYELQNVIVLFDLTQRQTNWKKYISDVMRNDVKGRISFVFLEFKKF